VRTIDEEIETTFQNDKHRFVTNMIYTSNWIQNTFNTIMSEYGLSVQQYNILRILRGAGEWVAMSSIKRKMIDKSPHTTRLVDKLLDKKLVQRKRSEEDRRVVYVKITKAALELMVEMDAKSDQQMTMLTNITDEEAKLASTIIDKLRN